MISLERLAIPGAAALLGLLAGCQTAPKPAPPPVDAQALVSKAAAALQAGDCRTASENYADAAQVLVSANLARRATRVAVTCQNLPAAWKAAERWHALAPEAHDATLIYGTVALSLYHLSEARAALTSLVRGQGEEGERNELSLIALFSEDPDIGPGPTLAALGGTVDAHSSTAILTAFGALSLEAYDFELARKRAEEVLAREPRSAPALRLLASVEVGEGNDAAAIATARKLIAIDPSASQFELVDVLASLDRLDDARAELERLHGAGVSSVEIDRRLAVLDYQSGDLADARRLFTSLLADREAGASAYLYLGDIAARSGDDHTALTEYRQLSESPLALTAGTRTAGILLDEGERSQALGVFDSYESEHPENAVDVALAKAGVFANHGDAKDGLTFIAAALERFPGHPRLEYERATLLEQAGEVRKSVAAFEQLLRERPGDPAVMNALGYTLADNHLELKRAQTLIERALVSSPDDPAMLDSLGWVRLRRGSPRAALPLLARAYRISRDPEIAAHWGEALWMSGERSEARKVWSEALARNPDSRALKETMRRLVRPVRG